MSTEKAELEQKLNKANNRIKYRHEGTVFW